MPAVAHCMTSPVTTVDERELLGPCARTFETLGVRHLPVVDTRGRLRGMLVREDVFAAGRLTGSGAWIPSAPDKHGLKARDLAQPAVTCTADEALHVVLERMLAAPHRAVVVVDAALVPGGIVTERDAVKLAATFLPIDFALGALEAPLVTVGADQRVVDALNLMDAEGLRHLIVAEDGLFQSIVERAELLGPQVDPHRDLVGDVMVWERAPTGPPGLPLGAAARRMARDGHGALALVDEHRRVRDIVTSTDVAFALADALAQLAPAPAAP